MSYYKYDVLMSQAENLAQKIIKRYKSHGVSIDIKDKGIKILEDRFKFKIKLLPGTRVDHLDKYAKDIQVPLKLPLFQVMQEDLAIFIIASKEATTRNNLIDILATPEYQSAKKSMNIAHPIGLDATNRPVIADLSLYPHLMICGTTGSGKSVALKSLLLSLFGGYSPDKINLLICDKGGDLWPFSDLPHLSYPIIQDIEDFLRAMTLLQAEMERRISIKHSEDFSHLPAIVCVIDEFLAFISGVNDKKQSKIVRDTMSDILRRGRHARIHLVLGAHNPTKENMKIDMSDVPSKIALRVSKFSNSVTILGQSGAEKLLGKGDMLFQSSQNDDLQRLQGAFISPDDTEYYIDQIRSHYERQSPKPKEHAHFLHIKYGFMLKKTDFPKMEINVDDKQMSSYMTLTNRATNDALLAQITIWALGHDLVSSNKIIETFKVGWRRANGFLKNLCEFGIVEDRYAKLSRKVRPGCLEDLSPEIIDFLKGHGYTLEHIEEAINSKGGKRP